MAKKAVDERHPTDRPVGVPRSKRALHRAEVKAMELDQSSSRLSQGASQIRELVYEIGCARSALLEFQDANEDTNDEAEAKRGGACTAQLRASYAEQGISLQRYWNECMIGPDCRKCTENHEQILSAVQDKINSIYPDGVPDDDEASRLASSFKKRHGDILKCMNIIGHFTRKVDILTELELNELDRAIKEFEKAWVSSYPDHPCLMPKAQIIVDLIMKFARHYGTIGVFGEDGIEALHPLHSRVRALVKSMRNPTKSLQAEQGHLIISQQF